VAARYRQAKEWYWVQEEPQNMGGWQFIQPRVTAIIDNPLTYIGRKEASSPATGFPEIFKREQEEILVRAVGALPSDPDGQIS
jgi:2-oxoglutarate dehydrogenase E1 component